MVFIFIVLLSKQNTTQLATNNRKRTLIFTFIYERYLLKKVYFSYDCHMIDSNQYLA